MNSTTPSKTATFQDENAHIRVLAARDAGGVVVDRRAPDFWRHKGQLGSVVRRDPCFVIALDTGNS